MSSNLNDIVINIDELQKQIEKKEKYYPKPKEFFYCSKGLVQYLELKINNNSIFDYNSKQILYLYNEYLEPISLNRYFIKQYNKFHLIITLDGGIKIEYQGKIFNNKLYHNSYFIIDLKELIEYCRSKSLNEDNNYYEYFSIFISNAKTHIKSEITLDGITNYFTSNPIIINDIPYMNCQFEFFIYC